MSSLRLALKQSLELQEKAPPQLDEDDFSSENEYESGEAASDSHNNKAPASSSKGVRSHKHNNRPVGGAGGGGARSISSPSSSAAHLAAANTIQAKWKKSSSRDKTGNKSTSATSSKPDHNNQSLPSPYSKSAHTSITTSDPTVPVKISSKGLQSDEQCDASMHPQQQPLAHVRPSSGTETSADAVAAASAVAATTTSGSSPSTNKPRKKNKTVPPPDTDRINYLTKLSAKEVRKQVAPGLRVKVRFATIVRNKAGKQVNRKKWYGGRVSAVSKEGSKIRIRYDDGTSEVTRFPDQDVVIDDTGNGTHESNFDFFVPPISDVVEPKRTPKGSGLDPGNRDELVAAPSVDKSNGGGNASSIQSITDGVVLTPKPIRKRGRPKSAHTTPAVPSSSVKTTADCTIIPILSKPIIETTKTATAECQEGSLSTSTLAVPEANRTVDTSVVPVDHDPPVSFSLPHLSMQTNAPSTINDSEKSQVTDLTAQISTACESETFNKLHEKAIAPSVVVVKEPTISSTPADSDLNENLLSRPVILDSHDDALAILNAHRNCPLIKNSKIEATEAKHDHVDPLFTEQAVGVINSGRPTPTSVEAKEAKPLCTIQISAKSLRAASGEEEGEIIEGVDHERSEELATKEATAYCEQRANSVIPIHPLDAANEASKSDLESAPADTSLIKAPEFVDDVQPPPLTAATMRSITSLDTIVQAAPPKSFSHDTSPKVKDKKRLHIVIPKLNKLENPLSLPGSYDVEMAGGDAFKQRFASEDAVQQDTEKDCIPRQPNKQKRANNEEDLIAPADGDLIMRNLLDNEVTPLVNSPLSRKRVHDATSITGVSTVFGAPFRQTDDSDELNVEANRFDEDFSARTAPHKGNEGNDKSNTCDEVMDPEVLKKKSRKHLDVENLSEGDVLGTDTDQDDSQWVQCDKCSKWRIIPTIVVSSLPKQWYCADNVWDPKRASCDAPEQTAKQASKERKRRRRLQQRLAAAAAAEEEGEALAAAAASNKEPDELNSHTPRSSPFDDELFIAKNENTNTVDIGSSPHPVSERDAHVSSVGVVMSEKVIPKDDILADFGDFVEDDTGVAAIADKKRGRGRPRRNNPAVVQQKELVTCRPTTTNQSSNLGDNDNLEWVQCEKCNKWRKLPPHVSADDLPEVWFCDMNTWNPSSASCDAPEDKADGLQDVGFHAGNGSGKLSFRNLIFGNNGRKANRPVSERMRATESLFLASNDDEDAPPAVMYANSSCYLAKGRSTSVEENSSKTIFDELNNSNLWAELWKTKHPPFGVQTDGVERFVYYTYDTLPTDAQELIREFILSVLDDTNQLLAEIVQKCRMSPSKIRRFCTIDVVVTCLCAMVKEGVVECIQKMGPHWTMKDWDPRFRRANVRSRADSHKLSRCIKIAKPWKQQFSSMHD